MSIRDIIEAAMRGDVGAFDAYNESMLIEHVALMEAVLEAAVPLNQANIHGYNYDTERLSNALASLTTYRKERNL